VNKTYWGLRSPLVREAFERCSNIEKVYADKAHDNRKNFNLLDELNAEPVIGIRNNASTRSRGCRLRREEVLLIKRLGYEGWKRIKDAGRRWIGEIVLFSIKRVLGEDLLIIKKILCAP